jgi:hypothetical protein
MCQNLDLRFLLFYRLLSKFFFRPFSLSFFGLAFYCLFSFCQLVFVFIVFRFPSSFLTLFYSCFFGSRGFISSLPQLAWD